MAVITVAITGSSGKLGRQIVRDVGERGYRVIGLDRVPDPASEADAQVRVELTDHGPVHKALTAVHDRHAVLGLPFATPPPYIPVDEAYPPQPQSTYSLVKTLAEEMARQLRRWVLDLQMIGPRFSDVMAPPDYAGIPAFDADPRPRSRNLWAYIDGRDAAQAVRRALEHDAVGADVFIIANADTVMSRGSTDLAAAEFPDVPLRHEVGEHETRLSIAKARRVLGYEPQHTWRSPRHG